VRAQAGEANEALPSEALLPLLVALQPLLLLAVATAAGVRLAARLGLRSHLAEAAAGERFDREQLLGSLPLAVGLGAAAAAVLVLLDVLTLPYLGDAGTGMGLTENRSFALTLVGVLYGGITEEILMRWGLMTALAWAGTRLSGRRGPGVMWTAVWVAALLFGAGHLPALVTLGIDLSGPVVARTLALNGVGGVVFGWLYWRRSLEAAMVAHATVHLVWTVIAFF